MKQIIYEFKEGNITQDSILTVLQKSVEQEQFSTDLLPKKISREDFATQTEIEKQIVDQIFFTKEDRRLHHLVGKLMTKFRGQIAAREVAKNVGFNKNGTKND